jgi:endonuclease G, mitochondrial
MDTQTKAKRLKEMLTKISPDGNINTVLQRPHTESSTAALESLRPTMDVDTTLQSGKQKLADDRINDITPTELFALEAIVMKENRPVTFVRGDSYDDLADPWLSLNQSNVRSRISGLLPSIGRVEVPLSPLIPYAGTGFIVGKGLLMTNRHVAQLFSQGLGLNIRYHAGESAVDFKRQIDDPDDNLSHYLKVVGVTMIHPYWDMALLQVEGLHEDDVLPLSITSPEDLTERDIVVIGYPARDDRSDLALQDKIFGGKYNIKRLQPGTVRDRVRVRSFENTVNAMVHDASTLGGNSGSAIVHVKTGQVVGLHFAGEYLKANYAVPMYELARDSRVAPLLNFQGSQPPTNEWETAWQNTGIEGSVSTRPSPPLQSPTLSPAASGDDGPSAIWTIPLSISVSIGTPVQARPATPKAPAPYISEVEEGVVVDQDYGDRPGYDPKFLGDIEVPLPKLTKKMQDDTAEVSEDARKNGDLYELAYYHYSVYMNKRRRTAWFSAANVDGSNRPDIGKRSGDKWYTDTRIEKSEQLSQDAFEHGIDRGHLTRREDTAWGKTVKIATLANNDTFHFTNCSLQASSFNRGKDRWQGLEQFLLEKHAKKSKQRIIVITGPLFASSDPVYKNDKMGYSVRCPLQFWKVCVLIRQDDTPSATAFILGQEEIKDLPGFEEAFNVSATQITIADLEDKTGLGFGILRAHDHFAARGAPGTLESISGTTEATRRGRVIREMADITV